MRESFMMPKGVEVTEYNSREGTRVAVAIVVVRESRGQSFRKGTDENYRLPQEETETR